MTTAFLLEDSLRSVALEGVDTLHRLSPAPDLRAPWRAFQKIVEHPGFLLLGEPARSARLEGVIAQVAGRILKSVIKPDSILAFHIPERGLWHGLAEVGGTKGLFYCFVRGGASLGMLGIVKETSFHLARFEAHGMLPS